jgi:Ser/Thr protein kinase RdoA (MazF antagonist)
LGTEDAREDLGCEAAGDSPPIRLAEGLSELFTVLQSDRRPIVRMYEQVVLSEEAGEEQSVPLLVRALGDEEVELVPLVAELTRLRAQPATKPAILIAQMCGRPLGRDGQRAEGRAYRLLRRAAALDTCVVEKLPLLGCEYRHCLALR